MWGSQGYKGSACGAVNGIKEVYTIIVGHTMIVGAVKDYKGTAYLGRQGL